MWMKGWKFGHGCLEISAKITMEAEVEMNSENIHRFSVVYTFYLFGSNKQTHHSGKIYMACILQDANVLRNHQYTLQTIDTMPHAQIIECLWGSALLKNKRNFARWLMVWYGIMYPQNVITDPYPAITKKTKCEPCVHFFGWTLNYGCCSTRVWLNQTCECLWILIYALVGKSGWRWVVVPIFDPYRILDTLSTKRQFQTTTLIYIYIYIYQTYITKLFVFFYYSCIWSKLFRNQYISNLPTIQNSIHAIWYATV